MNQRFSVTRLFIILMLAVVIVSPEAVAFWNSPPVVTPPRGPAAERWSTLFSLDRTETYTYRLTAFRRGRYSFDGELNVALSGSVLHYWYNVGKMSARGTSTYDPQALAGGILISAFTGSPALDWPEMQLLATPFHFVEWFDQFKGANYAHTVVWEEFTQPATRLQVSRRGWFNDSVFDGVVRRGRDTLLELEIDLHRPLPVKSVVVNGDWRFEAELVSNVSTRPILR